MDKKYLKKYFEKNFLIIFLNTLYVFGLFISLTSIPNILITEHKISDKIITLSGVFFTFAFLLGISFSKELIKYKFNYFLVLRILFLIGAFLWFIFYQLCHFHIIDKYQYLYLIYRFMDGFISSFIFFIITNLLNIKLLNNIKRLEILSIQNTISYLVKSIAPVLSAIIIVYIGQENIFLLSFFISFFIFLIIYYKNFYLLREYHRYRLKKINKNLNEATIKIFTFKSIFPSFKIFETNKIQKINYYYIITIHSSFRNFYDLIYIIFLTQYIKFDIIKSSMLISILILGQSMQYFSSILFNSLNKKIRNKKYEMTIYLIIIYFPFIFLLITIYLSINNEVFRNFYLYIILSFLAGFSRAFFANFQEYYNFKFINKDKNNFSEYEGNKVFFSEIGNLSGYLISTLLLFFNKSFIIIELIIFILISLYISTKTKKI